MMLVDPQYRRRGIATALMRAAMDYLQEIGVACIKLDATPEGEFVYRRLGFESEWPFQRWMREGDGSNAVIDSGQGTYHPVSTDEDAFGVDRTVWLRLVAQGSRIVYRSSHCPAFGMLRQGANASYLGPVTAADSETAESIVRELLKEIRGRVIWDMPSSNTAGVDLCRKLGFQPVRDLLRMWTGRTRHNPNVSMQFGFCDPGTG